MLTLKNALFLLCIFFVSTAFSQGEITINDDCSNALLLPVGSSCVLDDFTSIGATSEPAEIAPNPGCGGFQGGDVWFVFEVPASGNFRIEMNSSGNNAQWELYSGTCGDFTALACASSGNQLGKNFVEPSLAGETLYLRSWRFLNDDGIDFSLCIWEITPPVNDNCADAIGLTVGETCVFQDFSTQYAVSEPTETAPNPGCGGFQGGDVWFAFEVPASGNFRIEMNSSANNSQWELYSGTCGDFTALACASSGNQLGKNFVDLSLAGETLYLRSWRFLNDDGIDFSLCIWEITPPVNDNCADAIGLTLGETCILEDFSSQYAVSEPTDTAPNPGCGGFQGGDVWFSFEVPASGNFRIEMNSSANNSQWELYSGTCGDFTALSCASTGNQVRKNFAEPDWAGETLHLRSWRFLNDDGIDFSLCIWEIEPPVNDQCANAINLSVGEICAPEAFSSQYATAQSTDVAPNPTCGGYQGGDIWYTFNAPESGNFRIEMSSVGNNSQWELYSGTCGDFTALACASTGNQLSQNFIEPDLAGETLYLRSFRFLSPQGIDFTLCISELAPPENNDCSNATSLVLGEECTPQEYSTLYATAENESVAPDPTCGGYQGGDVWFSFEVPETGNFRVESAGIGASAQWSLYSGSCGNFSEILCATGNRNFSDPALANQTVYLRFFRFLSPQAMDFTLCVSETTPPENNNCADAIFIDADGNCVYQAYSSLFASSTPEDIAPEPNCGLYVGSDIWFTFEAPESGAFSVNRNNLGNGNAHLAFYTGTCGAFTEISCSGDVVNDFNDPDLGGETIYIRAWRFNSAEATDFEFCISFADCNGDFGGDAFTDNCGTCVGGNTGEEPCEQDCNGDFGGDAFTDNCGTCVGGNTGEEPCEQDCNGDFGGDAFTDNCGTCVGGNTGEEPCEQDCNGDFGGEAFTDNCGTCVGGNTGEEPCEEDCNGDFGGDAFTDNCGTCVGGNTGEEPCEQDCNGDFGGDASTDNCGTCVGGNTGEEPCEQDCNGDFGGDAFTDNCGTCVGGNTGEEPCTAEITGSVIFENGCGDMDGAVLIYQPGTNILVDSIAVSFNSGEFLAEGIAPGEYNIYVKPEGYLQKLVPNVMVIAGGNDIELDGLIPGDFTGNNTVEMADFSLFSCKYGLHFTDEEYDPIADINCNGVIDIADFSMFSVVYGLSGDEPGAAQ